MISPREVLEEHREAIIWIDQLLAKDLPDYQRKGYEKLREDCVWFIKHMNEEDCV